MKWILALTPLFALAAGAPAQSPRRPTIMAQAPPVRITRQAPCDCAVTGYCTCLTSGSRCDCPGGVGTPRTKRATDGGPDWYAGKDGYWYRELPGPRAPVLPAGYAPGPYGLGLGAPPAPMGYGYPGPRMMGGGGRGCSGGS